MSIYDSKFLAAQLLSNYSAYKEAIFNYSDLNQIVIDLIQVFEGKGRFQKGEYKNLMQFTWDIPAMLAFVLWRTIYLGDFVRDELNKHPKDEKLFLAKLAPKRNFNNENEYNQDIMPNVEEFEKKNKLFGN